MQPSWPRPVSEEASDLPMRSVRFLRRHCRGGTARALSLRRAAARHGGHRRTAPLQLHRPARTLGCLPAPVSVQRGCRAVASAGRRRSQWCSPQRGARTARGKVQPPRRWHNASRDYVEARGFTLPARFVLGDERRGSNGAGGHDDRHVAVRVRLSSGRRCRAHRDHVAHSIRDR